jgi:hypothetical protein
LAVFVDKGEVHLRDSTTATLAGNLSLGVVGDVAHCSRGVLRIGGLKTPSVVLAFIPLTVLLLSLAQCVRCLIKRLLVISLINDGYLLRKAGDIVAIAASFIILIAH